MRIDQSHWMQVEAVLARGEDRAVLPLGSIEQHAYLSLATDAWLSAAVAQEAAAPLGVPVFPVQGYGYTPAYAAFPGTLSLRLETFLAVVLAHLGLIATLSLLRRTNLVRPMWSGTMAGSDLRRRRMNGPTIRRRRVAD